jgi:hypothetical protein
MGVSVGGKAKVSVTRNLRSDQWSYKPRMRSTNEVVYVNKGRGGVLLGGTATVTTGTSRTSAFARVRAFIAAFALRTFAFIFAAASFRWLRRGS